MEMQIEMIQNHKNFCSLDGCLCNFFSIMVEMTPVVGSAHCLVYFVGRRCGWGRGLRCHRRCLERGTAGTAKKILQPLEGSWRVITFLTQTFESWWQANVRTQHLVWSFGNFSPCHAMFDTNALPLSGRRLLCRGALALETPGSSLVNNHCESKAISTGLGRLQNDSGHNLP